MAEQKRIARKPVQAGERFGRLVTLSKLHRMSGMQKVAVWECRCDCGEEVAVRAANLTNAHTKSCGCLQAETCANLLRTHGAVGSLTYRRWAAMKSRCHIETDTAYPNYGARGVAVCERWLDFSAFLADMGVCPAGLTLDRIDNSKGYEPGNCRWATIKQQANNKTSNLRIAAFGETATLAEWADRIGINSQTLRSRIIRAGWSIERALTTPVGTAT